MAPPQKREDLCTLFWLPLLTPPASPLMRKMVLEYHFDHFILLLSAALILVSVQSVGPNPLMNVFFWGFTRRHIPTSGQWTAGWLQHGVFYFIPHCQMFMFAKQQFVCVHIGDDSWAGMNGGAKWSLAHRRLASGRTSVQQRNSFLIRKPALETSLSDFWGSGWLTAHLTVSFESLFEDLVWLMQAHMEKSTIIFYSTSWMIASPVIWTQVRVKVIAENCTAVNVNHLCKNLFNSFFFYSKPC